MKSKAGLRGQLVDQCERIERSRAREILRACSGAAVMSSYTMRCPAPTLQFLRYGGCEVACMSTSSDIGVVARYADSQAPTHAHTVHALATTSCTLLTVVCALYVLQAPTLLRIKVDSAMDMGAAITVGSPSSRTRTSTSIRDVLRGWNAQSCFSPAAAHTQASL